MSIEGEWFAACEDLAKVVPGADDASLRFFSEANSSVQQSLDLAMAHILNTVDGSLRESVYREAMRHLTDLRRQYEKKKPE